jgi:LuxR family maltose regulon positive regulatory protein
MAYRAALAPTQVRRPVRPAEMVDRRRLRAVLSAEDALGRQVVLVSAGAGWGKSTVLVQRAADLEEAGVPVAWVTCSDGMGPRQFWSAVLVALETSQRLVRPDVARMLGDLALPSTVSETAFLAALVAHMDTAGPAALVLDEFQHAPSKSVALLANVIDAAGAELRFLVGTRWDPAFPAGRWQAQGRLQQLRGPDLAFDPDETRQLLELSDVRLPPSESDRLHELTEGWPVALGLAAASLRHHPDPGRFFAQFASQSRPMSDYLVSELFGELPHDLASFMVDISAPDEVTADLAHAITGRQDAGRLLSGLAARWTMVAGFDDDPPSYRFHSLLRGYLRAEAHRRDLLRQRHVHGVTARWLTRNRAPEPALRHAVLSQDWALVHQLLDEHGLRMIMSGNPAVVQDGLEALPAGVVELGLAARLHATAAALSSDGRRLRLNLGRLPVEAAAGDGGHASAWTQVLSLVADRLDGQRPSTLRARLAALDPTLIVDSDLRLLVAAVRGSWWIELNDFESAETDLREALRGATALKRDYLVLDCRSRLCLVSAAVGDFSTTVERCDEAISWASARGLTDQPLMTPVFLMRAWAAWDGLDEASAQRYLARARAVGGDSDPQVEASASMLAADLALARSGDHAPYRRFVSEWWEKTEIALVAPVALSAYLTHELAVALRVRDESWGRRVVSRATEALPDSGDVDVLCAMRAVHRGDLTEATDRLELFAGRGAHPVAATTGHLLAAFVAHARRRQPATGSHLRAAVHVVARRLSYRPFTYVPAEVTDLLAARVGALGDLDLAAVAALRALRASPVSPAQPLTERERALLTLLPTQLSVTKIAEQLGVSPNTTKTHLRSLYQKVGAHTRAEALAHARLHGHL